MLHIIKGESLEYNREYYRRNYDIEDVIIEGHMLSDGSFNFTTTRELFFEDGTSVINALNNAKHEFAQVISGIVYQNNEVRLRDKYSTFDKFIVFSFDNLDFVNLLEIVRVSDQAEIDLVINYI